MTPETVGDSVMAQVAKSRNIRAQIDELTELRAKCLKLGSIVKNVSGSQDTFIKCADALTGYINLLEWEAKK